MNFIDVGAFPSLIPQLIRTGVLLGALFLTRWFALNYLRKQDGMPSELRRRWASQVRLFSLLLLALGLAIIWGTALRTFALSLVAIAAALVIATKELITCIAGGVVKVSSRSFDIGDRIRVGEFRGDVVDHGLLSTTLLEIGPSNSSNRITGRRVVVPNALFVTLPVINESFLGKFVLHTFTVHLPKGSSWQSAESRLRAATARVCAPYAREAEDHIQRIFRRESLSPVRTEPQVLFNAEDSESRSFTVRIAVPHSKKSEAEQEILRSFFDGEFSGQGEGFAG